MPCESLHFESRTEIETLRESLSPVGNSSRSATFRSSNGKRSLSAYMTRMEFIVLGFPILTSSLTKCNAKFEIRKIQISVYNKLNLTPSIFKSTNQFLHWFEREPIPRPTRSSCPSLAKVWFPGSQFYGDFEHWFSSVPGYQEYRIPSCGGVRVLDTLFTLTLETCQEAVRQVRA